MAAPSTLPTAPAPHSARLPSTHIPHALAAQLAAVGWCDVSAYRYTEPLGGCEHFYDTGDTDCPPAVDEVMWTDGDGVDHHRQTCHPHTPPTVRDALDGGVRGEVVVEVGVPAVLADTAHRLYPDEWHLRPYKVVGGAEPDVDGWTVDFDGVGFTRAELPHLIAWLTAVHEASAPAEQGVAA